MKISPYLNYPGSLPETIGGFLRHDPVLWLLGWKLMSTVFAVVLFLFFVNGYFRKEKNFFHSSYLYLIVLMAGIILLRIPNLILPEMNVDESFWIATAAKYLSGALPWKTVEGSTGGPLQYMTLSVMYYLGEGLNYASIRLFGLLFCIVPSVVFVFIFFKRLFDSAIASLLIIPLTLFFVFINSFEIVSYNTEHIPMCMTAASILLLFALKKENKIVTGRVIALGLLLGLFAYAKLQAMPIAFAIGCCAVWEIVLSGQPVKSSVKQIALLILGGLIPTLFVLLYLLRADAFTIFWNDYIMGNLLYAHKGLGNAERGWRRWFVIADMISVTADTMLYFSLAGFMLLFSTAILALKNSAVLKSRKTIYLAVVALFSYIAVNTPGNDYGHYQLLFVIPFTMLSGYLFGQVLMLHKKLAASKVFLAGYFLIFIASQVGLMWYRGNKGIKFIRDGGNYEISNVSKEIIKYARPGDEMAIWGWADEYYLETGLIQAAKESHPYYELINLEQNNPSLKNYVAQLESAMPAVFVDGAVHEAFYFNKPWEIHENYLLLNDFINKNYQLAAKVDERRIYVLNSRLEEIQSQPKL